LNKKKGFLSAGALFMGLVVVLGLMGIVNGLWSKNLVVDGVVETGDLNADWDCGYTNDDGASGPWGLAGADCGDILEPSGDTGLDPISPNNPWDFPYADPLVRKNVGKCELRIDGPGTSEFGAQIAHVKMSNAYPSYECTSTLFITNTGSIPFNVIGSHLTLDKGSENAIEYLGCGFDLTDPQVDPGEEKPVNCTVHVKEEARQSSDCDNSGWSDDSHPWIPGILGFAKFKDFQCGNQQTYGFDIEVCVAQWNEDPSTGNQPAPGVPFDADDFNHCKDSPQHEGPGGAGDGDGIVGDADLCPTVPGVPPDGCPEP
jgi:hypothetical protein